MDPEKTEQRDLPIVKDLGDTFAEHAIKGTPYTVAELLDVRTSLGQLFTHLALVAQEKLSVEGDRNYADIENGSSRIFSGVMRRNEMVTDEVVRSKRLESYLDGIKFEFSEEDVSFAQPITCDEVYAYDIGLSFLEDRWRPITTYFPSLTSSFQEKSVARRFLLAGRALSSDLFDKLKSLTSVTNHRHDVLLKKATFQKDSLDSLVEGVDSIIRAFGFFLPEYPTLSDSQDELAKAQEIYESGILNQFSLLLSMSFLADSVRYGIFPKYRLTREASGKLVLDPRLIRIINQKKIIRMSSEPRIPNMHGMGCPVGSHGLKLEYEGKNGAEVLVPERTGIDIITGLYLDYLRHYWNN